MARSVILLFVIWVYFQTFHDLSTEIEIQFGFILFLLY